MMSYTAKEAIGGEAMDNLKLKNMTQLIPVSKTLRFRLKPIGKTKENILNLKKIGKDFERNKYYPILKELADDYYRYFISNRLKDLNLDWEELATVYENYDRREKETVKDLENKQKQYRKLVLGCLTGELDTTGKEQKKDIVKSNKVSFNKIFKKDFISKILPDFLEKNWKESDKYENYNAALKYYDKFTTRLTGYWETRKNIFTDAEIVTSIPHRLINDNFPIFLNNIIAFDKAEDQFIHELSILESELKNGGILPEDKRLRDYFEINGFNLVCIQKGIDIYHAIVGGFVKSDGIKIQGINELINLRMQRSKSNGNDSTIKLEKLRKLKKQILEHAESTSFLIDKIDSDYELYDKLAKFNELLNDNGVFNNMKVLREKINTVDLSKVMIDSKHMNAVSSKLTKKWDAIKRNCEYLVDEIKDKDLKNRIKDYLSLESNEKKKIKVYFSLEEINLFLKGVESEQEAHAYDIRDFFKSYEQDIEKFSEEYCREFAMLYAKNKALLGNASNIKLVKDYLDRHIDEFHKWNILKIENAGMSNEIDKEFYEILDSALEQYSTIIHLYNLSRNYLTKKPSGENKVKINFDVPTLADGWSESKISDNRCILLRRNDKYYLGVINSKKAYTSIVENPDDNSGKETYDRMVYNLFPDVAKMIPKCSISKKNVKEHFEKGNQEPVELSESFVKPLKITADIYNLQNDLVDDKKKYQIDYLRNTGDEEGYKKALKAWIEFCLKFLESYAGTQMFDYSGIKESGFYSRLDEFYADVDECGYSMNFKPVNKDLIDSLVDNGELFLFQIYNKDFSDKSSGKKNLNTLYWLALFSNENLKSKNIRLNGNAEIFFRPIQIHEPTIHAEDSTLVNKYDSNNKPIPSATYMEICGYKNGEKTLDEISESARVYIESGMLETKKAKCNIVKNKRYTEEQLFFHVPLTFNASRTERVKCNDLVREIIRNNGNQHIIGIDRGERHLLYYSVIDFDGNIVEQGSLNNIDQLRSDGEIISIPYQEILKNREVNRQSGRNNWQNIQQIKDLKEGYLSHVIHKLCMLVEKYQAIIVLEDLNQGFKRGRFKVERQVYQNFEMALMRKFAFLSFKDRELCEPGGILNAYQWCNPITAYQDIFAQNGIVFYIRASYTSVVDPVSGFVNLFNFNKIKGDDIETFMKTIKSVTYDNKSGDFCFTFDYADFKKTKYVRFKNIKSKTWNVSTRGERIRYKNRKYVTFVPTEILKKALEKCDFKYEQDGNLLNLVGKLDENIKNNILKAMFAAFKDSLQLRNFDESNDYIISPVKNKNGYYFDSRVSGDNLPNNGDANGAYNIAKKGKLFCERVMEAKGEKVNILIKDEDWFDYIM